jgi:hypothetical protein
MGAGLSTASAAVSGSGTWIQTAQGNHGRKICWQKNEGSQACALRQEFQTAARSRKSL